MDYDYKFVFLDNVVVFTGILALSSPKDYNHILDEIESLFFTHKAVRIDITKLTYANSGAICAFAKLSILAGGKDVYMEFLCLKENTWQRKTMKHLESISKTCRVTFLEPLCT